jgi:hypothetical protein
MLHLQERTKLVRTSRTQKMPCPTFFPHKSLQVIRFTVCPSQCDVSALPFRKVKAKARA